MDPNPPDTMADSGQVILRYFFGAREALADLPRCMASAADASRVGKRNTHSGCIALPDNTFFGARHRCSGMWPAVVVDLCFVTYLYYVLRDGCRKKNTRI